MNASSIQPGVAVITGAASGIGAGLARHASSIGMRTVLADCDEAGLDNVASELSGDVATLKVDVRSQTDLEVLADLAYSRIGGVELLFNNAGVLSAGISWELGTEVWKRTFDVNVMGVVNGISAFVPRMIEAGNPARIINTASVGGFYAPAMMGSYCASKAAVVAITEALAQELATAPGNVTASVLAPGPVDTGIMREDAGAGSEKLVGAMRTIAAERGADPDDYAKLIFAAIERGEFWIVPQPEALDDRLRERTDMILERRLPVAPSGES